MSLSFLRRQASAQSVAVRIGVALGLQPGRAAGWIKTFSLRGIKDSPPYLHDGRLLTLEDSVEFFNLVLDLRLDAHERADLVAFLRQS